MAGGLNLYGFADGDPINFSDPFGLRADTSFADDRARQETQKCVAESQTCAETVGALARDPNIWTIGTGAVSEDALGETSYNWTQDGRIAGGNITIEGNDAKYAAAEQMMGAEATYRTVLVHETGHAVGNILIQGMSGRISSGWHCDERCALAAENAYRRELKLSLLQIRP